MFRHHCLKHFIVFTILLFHMIYLIQSLNVNIFDSIKNYYVKHVNLICSFELIRINKRQFIDIYNKIKLKKLNVKNVKNV